MDCGCVYVEHEGEGACFGPTYPKARKPRKCDECGSEIKKGERYERAAGTDGDTIWRNDTCPDCLSMRASFFCSSWSYGMLWEDLRTHIDDLDGVIASSCLVPLTPVARLRVCAMIEEAWEAAEKRERGQRWGESDEAWQERIRKLDTPPASTEGEGE